MSAPPDESPSVRSFRTFIPRPSVTSKRTHPERRVSGIAQNPSNAPPPISEDRPARKGVLRRGKTVLKRAVTGGGAFGVRKSVSVTEGLLVQPTKLPVDLDLHSLHISKSAQRSKDPIPELPPKSPRDDFSTTTSEPDAVPVVTNMSDKQENLNEKATSENPTAVHDAIANHRSSDTPTKVSHTPEKEAENGSEPRKELVTRTSYRKNPPPAPAEPDDGGIAYEAHVARICRTGLMERSVAAAVISAARQRGLCKKPKPFSPAKPAHHRPHSGFCNPWDSAILDSGSRPRGLGPSRTFFPKVAKDRRPPDEELAGMLLLAGRPDFSEGVDVLGKDKYALASHWIGHCTFLLQAKDLTVLTDPVWSPRLGPLGPKRLVPPACEINDLPDVIDVVILSSACYDSYDKNAVQLLESRVKHWLVPIGLKSLLVSVGISESTIVELDWWQEHHVNGSLFVCTPAQHCSNRDDALWCSWVVHAPHHRFFFCGGTGYRAIPTDIEDNDTYEYRSRVGGPPCPVFKEIDRRYGSCDTAFLPIGGYKPRVMMSEVQGDAIDMLFVHRDLRAKHSVAHRWGTFSSSDEGMLDAVRILEAGLASSPIEEYEFSYLRHGRVHVT